MTIVANNLIQFFAAGTVQPLGTVAGTIAGGAYSTALTELDVTADNVPYATFVIAVTYGTPAAADEKIELHLRRMNIQGANDEQVPALATGYGANTKAGEVAVSNIGTIQYLPLVVNLQPFLIKAQQTLEPYLFNASTQTINAGAALFADLKTYGGKP